MLPETGQIALILAFLLSAVQFLQPQLGILLKDRNLVNAAGPAALGQFLCLSIALGILTHAYVVSDFSVLNVYQNSHTSKPMIYKISGVWGNHEGSLLLWVWILALFGAAVATFGTNLPDHFKARVLSIQGLIGLGFMAFMIFTSNPFWRADPQPFDGQGLNPLLQDPGLALHPPALYLGYVGLSTSYSFAIAALLEGRTDAAWARWVRPWTMLAWSALTIGIALGSWWAYYELGWGGWWFWDPVENASFMPWLAATALLHSVIVVEKRDTLKSWTILLAIIAFSLSLLGTFLVRSGVLTSVHAFATDPSRGVFILLLLIVAIGGSLILYAWRAPSMQSGGAFAPVSRESALLLNNLLLATATATVLLGTLYPLILDVLRSFMDVPKISVGAPFFNATFVPLMIPLLLVLPAGTLIAWKRGQLSPALLKLLPAASAAVAVMVIWSFYVEPGRILVAFGFGLSAWLILGSLSELLLRAGILKAGFNGFFRRIRGLPASAFAVCIAHAGLGVMVAGMTASSALRAENILTMVPGESADIAGYSVELQSIEEGQIHNYLVKQAVFEVTSPFGGVFEVSSEKRFFTVENQTTTEAGIHTNFFRDIYLVLGEDAANDAVAVRLYYNPLVLWIWLGAGMMSLGGLISLFDRRYRIGAPVPHQKEAGKAHAA